MIKLLSKNEAELNYILSVYNKNVDGDINCKNKNIHISMLSILYFL
jgi:hypothetical protein